MVMGGYEMSMTEEMAKKGPLCPFAMDQTRAMSCLGDRCMAWRWRSVRDEILHNHMDELDAAVIRRAEETGEIDRKQTGSIVTYPQANHWVWSHLEEAGLPTKPTTGWCARLGKPEMWEK